MTKHLLYYKIDLSDPLYQYSKGVKAMSCVVHFKVPSTNLEASRKFYEAVFGWKFTKYEGSVEYWLITDGRARHSWNRWWVRRRCQ